MSEIVVGNRWLYDTLAGDATLAGQAPGGVHEGEAPSGSAYPLVLFQWIGGFDSAVLNAIRIWHSGVWIVKAIGVGPSLASLSDVAARIDLLLHRASGAPSGGVVHTATREAPHRSAYTDAGVRYVELGGRYRIQVSRS